MSYRQRVEGIPSNQPSIIHAFDRDGDTKIREIARSGYGQVGISPGDVIPRESTRSNPDTPLPTFDVPGQRGLQQDDCGDDFPAFGCPDCGHPVYVGRTCSSPVCSRCYPAAIKREVIEKTAKLEGLRRRLNAKYNHQRNHYFHHVVASLPTVRYDSDTPLDRAVDTLKAILEGQFGIEGFHAVYHPWRIKQEYRADQYDHGGAPGQGDMTWANVLDADDPQQYLKFDPHFHLFIVAPWFDYNTAQAVEEQSGWLFHRIEKGGDDDHVSVSDFEDLVHQLTYTYSHAGVAVAGEHHDGEYSQFQARMKGLLHDTYAPDGAADRALSAIQQAAPRLLGYQFVNTNQATCDAEIQESSEGDHGTHSDAGGAHPSSPPPAPQRASHEPQDAPIRDRPGELGPDASTSAWDTAGGPSASTSTAPVVEDDHAHDDRRDHDADQDDDSTTTCGAELVPIAEAAPLLDRDDWRNQAPYADALAEAVQEWRDRRDDHDRTTEDDPPPD